MKRKDFQIVCLRDRAHTHTLSHIIRVIFVTFVFIWRALMRKATNKYDAKKKTEQKKKKQKKVYTKMMWWECLCAHCTYVYLIHMICSSYHFVGWHEMRTSITPPGQLNSIDKKCQSAKEMRWQYSLHLFNLKFVFCFHCTFFHLFRNVSVFVSFLCCCRTWWQVMIG